MSILRFALIITLSLHAIAANAQEIVWQRTFGTPTSDWGMALVETPDGGFLAVGGSEGFRGRDSSYSRAMVVRVGARGDTIWQKGITSYFFATAQGITRMASGNYMVIGNAQIDRESSPLTGARYRMFVAEIDGNGDLVSERTVDSMLENSMNSARPTEDGGFIAVGGSTLTRFDNSGKVLWQHDFATSGSYLIGANVRQTADGGFIAVGQSVSRTAEPAFDIALWKVDAAGRLLWKRVMAGDSVERGVDVVEMEMESGGYVVIGEWTSMRLRTDLRSYRSIALRVDSSGNAVQRIFEIAAGTTISRVEKMPDGTLFFAGSEPVAGAGLSRRFLIVQTGADGGVKGMRSVGAEQSEIGIHQMYVTRSGGLAVIGTANDGMVISRFDRLTSAVEEQKALPIRIDLR